MDHKLEYMSKEDLKKIVAQKKQEIYELSQKLEKEKRTTYFWQCATFFSAVIFIVVLAIQAMKTQILF